MKTENTTPCPELLLGATWRLDILIPACRIQLPEKLKGLILIDSHYVQGHLTCGTDDLDSMEHQLRANSISISKVEIRREAPNPLENLSLRKAIKTAIVDAERDAKIILSASTDPDAV